MKRKPRSISARCETWTARYTQCGRNATVWLCSPRREDPIAILCRQCGEACVREYREKLGWEWALEPVEFYDSPQAIEESFRGGA